MVKREKHLLSLLLGLTLVACGGGEVSEDKVEPKVFEGVGVPCDDGPTCRGSEWPEWELEDFQPNSSRFETSYGLKEFKGMVTVMSLHAAWCGYCRAQAMSMDKMWKELQAEGHRVQFVTVNKADAAKEEDQHQMVYVKGDDGEMVKGDDGKPQYRCTFPLLQDTNDAGVWALHQGSKDDFFIYHADGTLALYLPHVSGSPRNGEITTRLSTDAGFSNLKNAILWVLGQEKGLSTVTNPENSTSTTASGS
ncbi:MAG: redoxin domain-containing protein [Myxococcota bacterium]|nr:redoxin domain-containing protein [Myxococcota bacterium]